MPGGPAFGRTSPSLAPAEPPPPERLNPFPGQTFVPPDRLRGPLTNPPVAQHPRLGVNFANYYKAPGVRAYADMRHAGASHDRITFDWFRLQPMPGPFTVTVAAAYDALLADAATAGIETLGVLIGAPEWASDPELDGGAYRLPRNLDLPWDDPNNYWGQFVYQVVTRYRDHVRAWEVWNEPNLDEFWPASPQLYARLLQVAYQAAKAADPATTVVLGGIFRGVNIQWIDALFKAVRDLPDAAANAFYHDAIGFHLYDGGHCSPFDELAYLRNFFWQPRVGDKPIWITESGIRVWDTPRGDGYALPGELASFYLTNLAYALANGAQRYYYFRAIDPFPDDPQPWGLLRNDGQARPSLAALRVAAQHLPAQIELAVPAMLNGAAVRAATFYHPQGRTTVVWNIGGAPQRVSLPAGVAQATLVAQDGDAQALDATDGRFTLDLAPAQNFRWNHPEGICQVASPPLIVIEAGVTPQRVWLPIAFR
ncbi:MAG: hypothetical protein KatS3mg053_3536 [Candidatus Roseilinea sp.]|nr:MAG: hypothetical protein KatS3mg053_3536 [Candidatus Roseilinea sp.]